jgi:hypothetical protein
VESSASKLPLPKSSFGMAPVAKDFIASSIDTPDSGVKRRTAAPHGRQIASSGAVTWGPWSAVVARRRKLG